MKSLWEFDFLVVLSTMLFSGVASNGLLYDHAHSSSTKCLAEPETSQYGGGIIVNPDFDEDLNGWNVSGQPVEVQISEGGNRFMVAQKQALQGFLQRLYLEEETLYFFSAWVQVSKGAEEISALLRTSDGLEVYVSTVMAKSSCWTVLKGGIHANSSSLVELYFECNNTEVDIWVDSVSLQPFTKEEWKSHQMKRIEQIRKRKVRFQATDANGTILAGAVVSIKQTKSGFPFGCAMTKSILTSTAYQNWFTSRFKVTVFKNEMKWYSTETRPGKENYTTTDAMVVFAEKHKISIRGHNILWDNKEYNLKWVQELRPKPLRKAATRRVRSLVPRYRGKVIGWDVVNENLHFSFFEDKLGKNASAGFFAQTHKLDQNRFLFMNEFNTIEYNGDPLAGPDKYLLKIAEIKAFLGNKDVVMGIGLQSHFGIGQPNIPYMKASLDTLGAVGLPLWLTEVDVPKDPKQAIYLEEILREGFSHPAVDGIIIWSGPEIDGCDRMCLTDYKYENTPAGDVVDKLIAEWKTPLVLTTTDGNGYVEASLYHGEYTVIVTHPLTNSTATVYLNVAKESHKTTVHVQVPI